MIAVQSLLLVMADGVRPDLLQQAIDRGELPSVAALAERGGMHTITTSFPSVTGPAYLPFLMGQHPAHLGMPGLRWYDRSRSINLAIGNARSYSGIDIWRTHDDVPADAPTLFELAAPSLASMSMFSRGATLGNIGRSLYWMLRSAGPHFRGDPQAWRRMEHHATREFIDRFARHRPRFSMLTLNTPDKFAHRWGTDSPEFRAALLDVDVAVAQAELAAARGGWRDELAIWVISDHGHAPVQYHDDLHGFLEQQGHRVIAHPRLRTRDADIALMIGGNAMGHVYLEPSQRQRRWWTEIARQWEQLHDRIVSRDSVDVAIVALSAFETRVTSSHHGSAVVVRHDEKQARWSYRTIDGDPLGLGGSLERLDTTDAWLATVNTARPDSLVQVAALAPAARGGDIVVSASEGWDLRLRHESVEHVSTHGALHRNQMLVPLILDRPASGQPQRTLDVVPSALQMLGISSPATFAGRSFL
jgi:arylsulfatase A-like enzyme